MSLSICFYLLLFLIFYVQSAQEKQPNIILILADDLGYNDLSFRGSNLIPTPNIDALAYYGRILDRHYVLPQCTPSRSALLTGLHPILLGTQGFPLKGGQLGGIPLSHKLLPRYLKDLGYNTHMVGKWHLGYATSEYLPTSRGFDSFLGYYNGLVDYYKLDYNQTLNDGETSFRGFDMHEGARPRWDLEGRYATDIITERAEQIIEAHDPMKPLFLYVSHLAAHTGTEEGDGLQAPPGVDADERFPYIKSQERRHYAAVVQALDASVGRIAESLAKAKLLEDSLILFLSDNGAPSVATDMQPNYGSNWPLRGVKFTLYEGGVRGLAIVGGPRMLASQIDQQVYHITDWFDIFRHVAGENATESPDAKQLFRELSSKNVETIPRDILLNFDEVQSTEGVLMESRWKIVKQNLREYGNYDVHFEVQANGKNVPVVTPEMIQQSKVALAMKGLGIDIPDKTISNLREQATVKCAPSSTYPMGNVEPSRDFFCKDYCVFDVIDDPCELSPISNTEVLNKAKILLESYKNQVVPQNQNKVDVNSDPRLFGNVWTPWLNPEFGVLAAILNSGQEGCVFCAILLLLPVLLFKVFRVHSL